jgi:hypothetical protein
MAAAMDQSRLPEDDGGRSPHKVVGRDRLDQLNNEDGCHKMGGWMTWRVLQLQKKMHFGNNRTRTTIKLDCKAMQCDDNYDDNNNEGGG